MNKVQLKEMSTEVIVGLFMFLILGGLGVLTIALSKENLLKKSYPMDALFEEVQGLRAGDNVLMRGVTVGRVKALYVEEEGVHVKLSLNIPARLHDNYRLEIMPSSILGGQYLALHPGTMDRPLLEEGFVARGDPPVDLVKETSEAMAAFRDALTDGGVLENLKSTMEQINSITKKLEEGEGTIGKLIQEDSVYNDLEAIAANLRSASEKLADGEGTLSKLIHDDAVYNDMKDITSNLKEVSERLANGEGSLGKFASDDELYDQATELMLEIRAAVDDLRESAPIVTFTSVFFGAL